MQRKISDKYVFITGLMVLVFCAGCQNSSAPAKSSAGPEFIPVKVEKVSLTNIYETLDYTGNIKAEEEVLVYPKVSGKIIQKVKEDGSAVEKNEAIAYIDRDEVGLKFQKAPVESPLKGIVGRVYVDIGSNVNSSTPVALVVDMNKVKVNLDVPEKYLPHVALGRKAKITVDAYPGQDFSGKVTKISPTLDLDTRTAPLEIIIDNPGYRLQSGMFARVSLVIQEYKNVPVILKEAIMGKAPSLYVYVIENNKAILKKVTLGIRQGPYFEVRSGLKEGDLVVIIGQQRLRDNAPVSVEIEKESKN
jgi:multidrug efflux pump subunit AcrA (membrane-fusion protein)